MIQIQTFILISLIINLFYQSSTLVFFNLAKKKIIFEYFYPNQVYVLQSYYRFVC